MTEDAPRGGPPTPDGNDRPPGTPHHDELPDQPGRWYSWPGASCVGIITVLAFVTLVYWLVDSRGPAFHGVVVDPTISRGCRR